MSIIKKPWLSFLVFVLVLFSIFYLESESVSLPSQNILPEIKTSEESKSNTPLNIREKNYPKIQEFEGISDWINTDPLTIEKLKGKVVLVDFWTYTCINCIRTLPYLKDWDEKYKEKGLVIIGMHTPEFKFEQEKQNVLDAVRRYNITYPVAQDNEYVMWKKYQNRYWPHEYLIDNEGYIRYDHIGEGGYDETEKEIQELLKERMEGLGEETSILGKIKTTEEVPVDFASILTPEIYLGYKTTRGNFGNEEGFKEDEFRYILPKNILPNKVYVDGLWKANEDSLELVSDEGMITLQYYAPAVNIVADSSLGTQAVISVNETGENKMFIKEARLYNLARSAPGSEGNVLRMHLQGKGFRVYTFTFG